MNFLENMQNRYTTKMYDTTKKIDLDKKIYLGQMDLEQAYIQEKFMKFFLIY